MKKCQICLDNYGVGNEKVFPSAGSLLFAAEQVVVTGFAELPF